MKNEADVRWYRKKNSNVRPVTAVCYINHCQRPPQDSNILGEECHKNIAVKRTVCSNAAWKIPSICSDSASESKVKRNMFVLSPSPLHLLSILSLYVCLTLHTRQYSLNLCTHTHGRIKKERKDITKACLHSSGPVCIRFLSLSSNRHTNSYKLAQTITTVFPFLNQTADAWAFCCSPLHLVNLLILHSLGETDNKDDGLQR